MYRTTSAFRLHGTCVTLLKKGKSTAAAKSSMINLRGIFPPVTTPFNNDETIAWDKLEENMAKLNKTNVAGYLVQGSNGEYCFLTKEERIDIVKKARQFASPEKLLLAGSGCESTAQTIEMSREMANAGADCLVVVTPSYFKGLMTSSSLVAHFSSVADASPAPIVLYNVPANTGVDLPADAVRELAKHPNVVGMKESGGDIAKIARMMHESSREDFQMLAGSPSFLMASLALGAVGGISALANAMPEQVCLLQELCEEGRTEEASDLQRRIIAPNAAVTRQLGVPGLKRAMEWFGYYGGPTRRPLMPLTADQEKMLRASFVSTGFLKE